MIYQFGDYEIDVSTRELHVDGRPVETEPKAFDLLVYLLEHRDRAVSKDEILEKIWPNQIVSETALTRAIMKARRAVGDDSSSQSVIRTLHGHGYRFVASVAELDRETASAAVIADPLAPEPAAPERRDGGQRWLAIAAMAATLAIGIAFFVRQTTDVSIEPGTLAVLPVYDAVASNDTDWVRLGLMSLMTRMLDEGGVQIAPDTLVISAVGDAPLSSPPDAALFEQIQNRAGADSVLHTTLDLKGGLHRLSAVITHSDGSRSRRVIVGDSPAAIAADMADVIAGMSNADAGDELSDSVARFSRVSTDPFVNELYARALALELEGELDEAREMFRVAAAQEPELFWLRYEIALCARDLDEHEAAKAQFEILLEEARGAGDARALVATLNSYGRQKLTLHEYDEAEVLLNEALDAAGERSLAEERAIVLINQALIDSWQGDDTAARGHYDDALAAYAEAERNPSPSFLNNYAGLLKRLGDLDTALEYSQQAVSGFQRRGQRRFEAPATNRLATIHRDLGDIDKAVELHNRARAIYADLGNDKGELSVMSSLTAVYREMGDLTRARNNADEVIERSLPLTDSPLALADAYIQAAYVEAADENYENAIDLYEQSIEVFSQINERRGIRAAQTGIARASIELGNSERAHDVGQSMLAAAGDDESAAARAHWLLGEAHLADSAVDLARQQYTLALDYARLNNDSNILGYAGGGLARSELAAGNPDLARDHLEEIRPYLETDHDFQRLDAQVSAAEGQADRAIDIMLALRSVAGESWKDRDEALLAELRND